MQPIPRSTKVQIMFAIFTFFGGWATGHGIGAWRGKTYVFEPLDQAPVIKRVDISVPTFARGSPLDHECCLVEVELDRMGRLELVTQDASGNWATIHGEGASDKFLSVLVKKDAGYWYPLAPGKLPNWLREIWVKAKMVGGEKVSEVGIK